MIYSGNGALVTPIITFRFLVDSCLFLLEIIGASNLGLLPFEVHLKFVSKAFSPGYRNLSSHI